jgi:hypothetical protein
MNVVRKPDYCQARIYWHPLPRRLGAANGNRGGVGASGFSARTGR